MLDSVPKNDLRERYGLSISRLGRMKCGSAWGHDGEAVGYSTWVRASEDGSHVVFLGATAGYYASDLFQGRFSESRVLALLPLMTATRAA